MHFWLPVSNIGNLKFLATIFYLFSEQQGKKLTLSLLKSAQATYVSLWRSLQ